MYIASADCCMRVEFKMADQLVQFVSKTELNAKKEEKRKAREQLLQQVRLQ